MKRFINLKIGASESKLIELLDSVKAVNTDEWKFEKQFSKDYASNISFPENRVACFKANSTKYYEAIIWMTINENELKITNIVSRKVPYLEKDNYNTILKAFYGHLSSFITKNFSVNITSDEVTIEELANKETAKKLKQWEGACNSSTGNTHPFDRERWFEFIKTAVDTNSTLTTNDLEQWLIEEKNWLEGKDDSITTKVVSDFEYGIDLLRYYAGKN